METIQYDGQNKEAVLAFCGPSKAVDHGEPNLVLLTPVGKLSLKPGWWVWKLSTGDCYPSEEKPL